MIVGVCARVLEQREAGEGRGIPMGWGIEGDVRVRRVSWRSGYCKRAFVGAGLGGRRCLRVRRR